MFLFRSNHRQPRTDPLNAIADTDQATRRARHLRQCERLAELGMDLAEDAHREAKRDLLPPTERRTPIPGLNVDHPGLPGPMTARDATFGHLFAVLSRCVRQAILLESRIAAGTLDRPVVDHPGAPPRAEPAADRAPSPPGAHPDSRPRLRPEKLEDDLAADATRSAENILAGICAELGAAIDASPVPPQRATPPPEQDKARPGRRPGPAGAGGPQTPFVKTPVGTCQGTRSGG